MSEQQTRYGNLLSVSKFSRTKMSLARLHRVVLAECQARGFASYKIVEIWEDEDNVCARIEAVP